MFKILFLVTLLYVAWRVLGSFGQRLGKDGASADQFSRFSAKRRDLSWRKARRDAASEEELMRCARCGVHVPSSGLVTAPDGQSVCGEMCASGEE